MRRRFMSVGIHCPILYKALLLLLFGFFAERIVGKTLQAGPKKVKVPGTACKKNLDNEPLLYVGRARGGLEWGCLF